MSTILKTAIKAQLNPLKLNNFAICIGTCPLSENINSPLSKIQDDITDYQKKSTIELQVAFSTSLAILYYSCAGKTTMNTRKETMVKRSYF